MNTDLCFVRSKVLGESYVVDAIKFSTLIQKLSTILSKDLINRSIEIFKCACNYNILYPDISSTNNSISFKWTNNEKFLILNVSDKNIEYIYGDDTFHNKQIGLLNEIDYSHRLLELSLFYIDEKVRPYNTRKIIR